MANQSRPAIIKWAPKNSIKKKGQMIKGQLIFKFHDNYRGKLHGILILKNTITMLVFLHHNKYRCLRPEHETHIRDNPMRPFQDHNMYPPLGWIWQSKQPHQRK